MGPPPQSQPDDRSPERPVNRQIWVGDEFHRLLKKSKEGDHESFDKLMKSSSKIIKTECWRCLRSWEEVEDGISETHLQVWLSIENLKADSRAGFNAWLRQVSRRAALAVSRQRMNCADIGDEQVAIQSHEDAVVIGGSLDWAFTQIKPEYVEALLLSTVSGLFYDEIAQRQHVAVSTVSTRIHRAKVALSRILEERNHA